VGRRRLDVRKPAFCEVPEAVAAASAGDRDLAPAFEELEHHSDVSTPVPAARLPGSDGAVDELAGQQRTAALELAEDVSAEARVLAQKLRSPTLPGVPVGSPAPHPRQDQREILD